MSAAPIEEQVQTCWTCSHAFQGASTYCPVYSEVIDNEVLAGRDCPAYIRSEDW